MKTLKAKKLLNGVINKKREDLAKMQVDIDYFQFTLNGLGSEQKLREQLKKENDKKDKKNEKKVKEIEAKIGRILQISGEEKKFRGIFNELVDYINYLEDNKKSIIKSMIGLL